MPISQPAPLAKRMTSQGALADLEQVDECAETSHVWSKAKVSPEQGRRRLAADRPATTIRAEHHGNIQWRYRLPRRISLREAARLQFFPDGFQFPNGMRETEWQRRSGRLATPFLPC